MIDIPDPHLETPANHLRHALTILGALLSEGGRGHLTPLGPSHREALERVAARVRAALRGIEAE